MSREQRREHMRRLLARREREGLTYRELASISGESPHTLASWASRLRREQGFVELVAGDEPVEEPSAGMSIVLANGHCVDVPQGFDEDELARLLRVVSRC